MMSNKRNIVIYKNSSNLKIENIIRLFDKFDNFETLNKCTQISHLLSGNIIKEHIDRNTVNTVRNNKNFFINLN